MPFHPFQAISRTICSAVLAPRRRRRLRKNYEKRCLICANPSPHAPLTSPTLILASNQAISSIRSHFRRRPLGGAVPLRRWGQRPNCEKRCWIGANPSPQAPFIFLDLIVASYNAISSICGYFRLTSTRRRGAVSTNRTASKLWKKVLNWGKSKPTSSLYIPRLDCGLIRCHFIHLRLFQTDVHSVARLRVDDEDCGQIVKKGVELGQIEAHKLALHP